MSEKRTLHGGTDDLRKRAEELVRMPDTAHVLSPEEVRQMLHELYVHQTELEIQNEDLRRTQEELEVSRERYFELYDLAPVGYLTVSEKGLILEANLRAAELLGTARSALIKLPLSRFILPEDQDIYYRQHKAIRAEGMSGADELRLVRKDGVQFWARLEAAGAGNSEGNLICRVVMNDITENKQAEEALRKAHEELESRVKERTAELTRAYEKLKTETAERAKLEDQLRQSQKMEAIGTLAGGIAHDFNNMLAAILGFTEMALEDLPDRPDVERNLQNVSRAAMRARDLVKQILAFSRKTGHERNPLSLTPIVRETVQLLRASIPTTIGIRFVNTATSDKVLASPVEIQQILMNLGTNASLAMQEKGGTMEVSLTDINFEPDSPVYGADVSPGEYAQLMVKDTGTGMSPDVMKRVFEPFFTTREIGKGTGMGLAAVYGIVKDLQGTITIESELGVGSTFSVLLPKVRTDAQAEVVQPDEIPGGNERILFVDDEEMLVEWGRVTLERLGYKVTAMMDSRDALKTFSTDPSLFDLVITDHTMPQMAGARLAKELLNIRRDIPIILCTGHSDNISPKNTKDIGVKEFLSKPFSKQELAEGVRRVLDEKDSG